MDTITSISNNIPSTLPSSSIDNDMESSLTHLLKQSYITPNIIKIARLLDKIRLLTNNDYIRLLKLKEYRTEQDISILIKNTDYFQLFKDNKKMHTEFLKVCTLEICEDEDILFNYGETANAFYLLTYGIMCVLLSDKKIHKTNNNISLNGNDKIIELEAGASIGELGLISENKIRNGTCFAKAKQVAILLRLSFYDYDRLLRDYHVDLYYNRLEFWKYVNTVNKWPFQNIFKLTYHTTYKHFNRGDTVITINTKSDDLFWLVKGRLFVSKPFLHPDNQLHEENIGFIEEGEMFGEIGCLLEIPRTANVRVFSETATIFSCSYTNLITAITPGDKPFTELIKCAQLKYNRTLGPGERSEMNTNNMLEVISPYLLKTCPTLSESSRKFIAANSRLMTYKKVYRKGDTGNYFYILIDGLIDLCKQDKKHKNKNSNLNINRRRKAVAYSGAEASSIQDSLIKFNIELNSNVHGCDIDSAQSKNDSLLFHFDTFGVTKLPSHLEILKNISPPEYFNAGGFLPDLNSYEFKDSEAFLDNEPIWIPIRQIEKSAHFGEEGIYNQQIDAIRLSEYDNSINSLETLINYLSSEISNDSIDSFMDDFLDSNIDSSNQEMLENAEILITKYPKLILKLLKLSLENIKRSNTDQNPNFNYTETIGVVDLHKIKNDGIALMHSTVFHEGPRFIECENQKFKYFQDNLLSQLIKIQNGVGKYATTSRVSSQEAVVLVLRRDDYITAFGSYHLDLSRKKLHYLNSSLFSTVSSPISSMHVKKLVETPFNVSKLAFTKIKLLRKLKFKQLESEIILKPKDNSFLGLFCKKILPLLKFEYDPHCLKHSHFFIIQEFLAGRKIVEQGNLINGIYIVMDGTCVIQKDPIFNILNPLTNLSNSKNISSLKIKNVNEGQMFGDFIFKNFNIASHLNNIQSHYKLYHPNPLFIFSNSLNNFNFERSVALKNSSMFQKFSEVTTSNTSLENHCADMFSFADSDINHALFLKYGLPTLEASRFNITVKSDYTIASSSYSTLIFISANDIYHYFQFMVSKLADTAQYNDSFISDRTDELTGPYSTVLSDSFAHSITNKKAAEKFINTPPEKPLITPKIFKKPVVKKIEIPAIDSILTPETISALEILNEPIPKLTNVTNDSILNLRPLTSSRKKSNASIFYVPKFLPKNRRDLLKAEVRPATVNLSKKSHRPQTTQAVIQQPIHHLPPPSTNVKIIKKSDEFIPEIPFNSELSNALPFSSTLASQSIIMPDEFVVNREQSNFVNVYTRETSTVPIKRVSRFASLTRPQTSKIISKSCLPTLEIHNKMNENTEFLKPYINKPELDKKMFHDYATNFNSDAFTASLNDETNSDLFGNIKPRESNALLDDIYTEKYHDLLKNNICQMIQGGRAIKLADPLKISKPENSVDTEDLTLKFIPSPPPKSSKFNSFNRNSQQFLNSSNISYPELVIKNETDNNSGNKKIANRFLLHQTNPLSPIYSPNSVVTSTKDSFYSPKTVNTKNQIGNVTTFDSIKMDKGKKDLHNVLRSKTRSSVLSSLISP